MEDIRSAISNGLAREVWNQIYEASRHELNAPPLTPRSIIEGRSETFSKQNNPDYSVCFEAGQRILRNALVFLVTEDKKHLECALRQIWALLDADVWPDWIDQAHLYMGNPADLRTGMLSQDVGIAYDWLYQHITKEQRDHIVEGLDRRGIQPFFKCIELDAWWMHSLNNWYTVIIGGLGIAGMALGSDHPKAKELVGLSHAKMIQYLSIYGPEGEFNESMAYSNSTRIPVNYFHAYHYHIRGAQNPLALAPFPETAKWTRYSTLAPGRYPAFGDGHVDAGPEVEFMTAIATATQDRELQHFCTQKFKTSKNPYLLLWFDPTLRESKNTTLKLAKCFKANAAQAYSRSDWNPEGPKMTVYGKAARDHNHEHNDVGQICIDSLGERMVTDPGSPSGYPADFFGEHRWEYYNASTRGHNVLMFGGREQRFETDQKDTKGEMDIAAISGKILKTTADPKMGSAWSWDLTPAYDGVTMVRRTMVHLIPGIAVILDEAKLEKEEEISLRWHIQNHAKVDPYGRFLIRGQNARITAQVSVLEGNLIGHEERRHLYKTPYDRDRIGDRLEQRREPYIETRLFGSHCKILTLFAAITSTAEPDVFWQKHNQGWEITTIDGTYRVQLKNHQILIESPNNGKKMTI